MVVSQLESRGIKDRAVLRAMKMIPRERFIPHEYQTYSYYDGSLPIGSEQTISQPYIVALMAQTLSLTKSSRVLEIGTGSGYNAAVLSRLCKRVYSVEIIPTLYLEAKERLENLGYKNISLRLSDGHRGWPELAPYDAVVFTAAIQEIPKTIFDQMKVGAVLVAPIGSEKTQTLVKITRGNNNEIHRENLASVRFVRMISMQKGKPNKKEKENGKTKEDQ